MTYFLQINLVLTTIFFIASCANSPLTSNEHKAVIESSTTAKGLNWPTLDKFRYSHITNPDIEVVVSDSLIQKFITSLIGTGLKIPLGKEGSDVGLEYALITHLSDIQITSTNTIKLQIEGNLHAKAWFAKANIGISEFEVDIHPFLTSDENGLTYINFDTAVTKLKMADFPNWEAANLFLARLVTKKINEDPPQQKFLDLNDAAGLKFLPKLNYSVIFIDKKQLIFQASRNSSPTLSN